MPRSTSCARASRTAPAPRPSRPHFSTHSKTSTKTCGINCRNSARIRGFPKRWRCAASCTTWSPDACAKSRISDASSLTSMSDKISYSIRLSQQPLPSPSESLVRRHPVAAYFALTFVVSWTAALLVVAPHLLNREPLPKLTRILMFPAMLLGPSAVGIVLTWYLDGSAGMRDLLAGMLGIRFPLRWYAALLIPPAMILAILLGLKALACPVYNPNRFLVVVAFG